MLLDGKYFNNIELDIVKDKYYSAKDVDDILLDIRKRAEAQAKDYKDLQSRLKDADKLKERLEEIEKQKAEISDTVVAARNAYKTIVEKATRQAEKILADSEAQANAKAERLLSEAAARIRKEDEARAQKEEFYVDKIEQMYSKLRQSHTDAIDELNGEWQDFLISLVDEPSAKEEKPFYERKADPDDGEIEVEIVEEPRKTAEDYSYSDADDDYPTAKDEDRDSLRDITNEISRIAKKIQEI